VLTSAAHVGPIPFPTGTSGEGSFPLTPGMTSGRAILERRTIHIPDSEAAEAAEFAETRALGQLHGHRTTLATPLLRQGVPLGAILIRRREARPFTEQHIKLLETFADQAAIAIANTRLFQELEQRNADLAEALEQQTATADVLKVISRSAFDLQPVLDTLAESAIRLSGAERGLIYRFDGKAFRQAAGFNMTPEHQASVEQHPPVMDRRSSVGRAALERQTVHIPDVLADPDYSHPSQELVGFRTLLAVPMLREETIVGIFVLFGKPFEVRPFTERQIELVETFADQAVIAIENTRLFQEVEDRKADRSEERGVGTEWSDQGR
jgi:GAF domain-containing protein